MNREDFLDMMHASEPLERRMIAEVSELVEIFPYFQSAHCLLLKALYDNRDVRFDNQLKQSSIYIGDRECLYYYLNRDKIFIKPEPAVVAETETEPAVNMAIEPDEETSADNTHAILIQGDSETDESPGIMMISEMPGSSPGQEISFFEPEYPLNEDEELLELIDDNTFLEDSKKSKRDLQTELIEKFIVANPKIEKAKEKSDIPVEDLSENTTEAGSTLITETLARIYTQQHYYSRAIEIYEKLSLKYPEKSSYFAAQIEKVKEYLKK